MGEYRVADGVRRSNRRTGAADCQVRTLYGLIGRRGAGLALTLALLFGPLADATSGGSGRATAKLDLVTDIRIPLLPLGEQETPGLKLHLGDHGEFTFALALNTPFGRLDRPTARRRGVPIARDPEVDEGRLDVVAGLLRTGPKSGILPMYGLLVTSELTDVKRLCPGADGYLGIQNLLGGCVVDLDLQDRTIRLIAGNQQEKIDSLFRGKATSRFRYTPSGWVVAGRAGDREVEVQLDTLIGQNMVDGGLRAKLQPLRSSQVRHDNGNSSEWCRLSSASIGPWQLMRPVFNVDETARGQRFRLGMMSLSGTRVVLDRINERCFVEWIKPPKLDQLGYEWAGIRTRKDAEGKRIVHILWDTSPAKQAGLSAGDIIEAIDDVPVQSIPDLEIDLQLNYRTGRKTRVTIIDAKGERKTLEYTPEKLL